MKTTSFKLPRRDVRGRTLQVGDVVRIVGVPDLSRMSASGIRASRPVFAHLLGSYKRIAAFDDSGRAELSFRIRAGRHRGVHWVWIEPFLLSKRQQRTTPSDKRHPQAAMKKRDG
jgi:hypothetical protein